MKITLDNKTIENEMIKGWSLKGDRVVEVLPAIFNGHATDAYFTKLGIYLHLNGSWYNGSRHPQAGCDLAAVIEGNPNIESWKAFTVTPAGFQHFVVSELTSLEPRANKAETPVAEPEAQLDEVSQEPAEVQTTRVQKKEARELFAEGVAVYAVKFNRKKDEYVEESETILSGDDFDAAVDAFYEATTSNKSNTHFRIYDQQ